MLYNNIVPLEKKLGFVNNNNIQAFIPKGVEIAKKSLNKFRNANKYVELYGGKLQEWSKRAGKIESAKYVLTYIGFKAKKVCLMNGK